MKRYSIFPYLCVMIFMLIIIVNASFFYLANSTAVGVITEDSYEKGLHYNEVIEQERQQIKSGIEGIIEVQKLGNDNKLIFHSNKSCDSVKAHIMRTIHNRDDLEVELIATPVRGDKNYTYEYNLGKKFFGAWLLRIKCYSGGDEHYFSRKFVLGNIYGREVAKVNRR